MARQQRRVIVIGAGPAGILASLHAARGAAVMVLEHSEYACLKLGLTGKGRCNVTNARPMAEYADRVPQGFDFLQPAFAYYPNTALRRDLEAMGVPTLEERGRRVFPCRGGAQAVRRALISAMARAGVDLLTGVRVLSAERGEEGFSVVFVDSDGEERVSWSDALVLATGGCSYPATGSDGSGYELVRALGHTVTPLFPSLVELRVANAFSSAAGAELRNVKVTLLRDGEPAGEEQGEVLCTRRGFGGSAILRLSRQVTTAGAGSRFELMLDLKPGLNRSKLRGRIARERDARPWEPLSSSLRALLPAGLVLPMARRAGLSLGKGWGDVGTQEIARLVEELKGARFHVVGDGGFASAVVTAGGVPLGEVEPGTMESRLVAGLYFAGELLDVDANTGGFNLQIAFSTGALAGAMAGGVGDRV